MNVKTIAILAALTATTTTPTPVWSGECVVNAFEMANKRHKYSIMHGEEGIRVLCRNYSDLFFYKNDGEEWNLTSKYCTGSLPASKLYSPDAMKIFDARSVRVGNQRLISWADAELTTQFPKKYAQKKPCAR